jgi:hypothetical protein
MESLTKIPKIKLDMNIITHKDFNMRGLIGHTAYYCKETDEFYQTAKSKSAKYGVLFFAKKADLEDYEAILTESQRFGEKWKFSKMRPHEINAMKRSSLFKAASNDMTFDSATVELSDHIDATP